MTGLMSPLPSYINRVYELQTVDGTRIIAKFYRPGRWTKEALEDEHQCVLDCADAEIPVISPLELKNNKTIGDADGIFFALFPKRFGREFEIIEDNDWIRMGSLLGRIHNVGCKKEGEHRVILKPEVSTKQDIDHLINGDFITMNQIDGFKNVTSKILETSRELFEKNGSEFIRVHGDCHQKNLLHRPGEGLMVIDFDDMMTAPPVQDLWLLLPDHLDNSKKEINLILQGYEHFREFDDKTLKLIEPLRAMRMIYFLAWCSKQKKDYHFQTTFPNWGSEQFWGEEVNDLFKQLNKINEHSTTYYI